MSQKRSLLDKWAIKKDLERVWYFSQAVQPHSNVVSKASYSQRTATCVNVEITELRSKFVLETLYWITFVIVKSKVRGRIWHHSKTYTLLQTWRKRGGEGIIPPFYQLTPHLNKKYLYHKTIVEKRIRMTSTCSKIVANPMWDTKHFQGLSLRPARPWNDAPRHP